MKLTCENCIFLTEKYGSYCQLQHDIYLHKYDPRIDGEFKSICNDFQLDQSTTSNDMNGDTSGYQPGSDARVDSSCYLTSACVDALGKEDDCHELTVLRDFRDNWLTNQIGGKKDIERYYACAPSVVDQIDKLPNRIQIYTRIYNELVLPCVALIEDKRMREAWNLYRDYSEKLIAEYALMAA